MFTQICRAPFTPSARLRQDSLGVIITRAGTDSLPTHWESLRQPGQLWYCRVAPPAVSRGATGSGYPTEVAGFVMHRPGSHPSAAA